MKPEDNLRELELSYNMGSRDQTQAVKCGHKHLLMMEPSC